LTEFEQTDETYLELYEGYRNNTLEMFSSNEVQRAYQLNFENKICVECSEPILSENFARIDDVDYMICEKDACWTISYISSGHLAASSYCVTFNFGSSASKIEVAQLANELWKYSQSRQIEMPISVESELFSNLEETGEGWFWVHFVPLHWTFNYEEEEDKEDLDEIRALTFVEKVNLLKERQWGDLAEYGWSDAQDSILSSMEKILVNGRSIEVTVSDFSDSKVRLAPGLISFYMD
jgi:hypothetical protein